jgi:hypothetical protein
MIDRAVKKRVKEVIETLSDKKARVALDFIHYLKEREEWEATTELLSDKKLLMDYKAARGEIKKGDTIKWTAIKRNV